MEAKESTTLPTTTTTPTTTSTSTHKTITSLDNFPTEIIEHIIQSADNPIQLSSLRGVSKLWFALSSNEELWKRFCIQRYKNCRTDIYGGSWRNYYKEEIHGVEKANQIIVHGMDGNYFLVDPETNLKSNVTTEATPDDVYCGQATWSPHGDYIAMAQFKYNQRRSEIILFNVKEKFIEMHFPAAQHPFYFYWSPDSTRLSLLSNWPPHSIALHSIDIKDPQPSLRLIGTGRPFYYSWNPEGKREIITHHATKYLEILDCVSGSRREISHVDKLGAFSAPSWISADEVVYVTRYAIQNSDGERKWKIKLICAKMKTEYTKEHLLTLSTSQLSSLFSSGVETKGKEKNELIDMYMNTMSPNKTTVDETELCDIDDDDVDLDFVSSPNGRYVAYSNGQLYLVDISLRRSSPDTKPIFVNASVLAFFWSPNSRFLLFMTATVGSNQSRWCIHDTFSHESYEVASFIPSTEFRQHYLPFFCQYAQSLTFFSPDSKFFVYAHAQNIYISGTEKGSVARGLCAGTFACWSHQ